MERQSILCPGTAAVSQQRQVLLCLNGTPGLAWQPWRLISLVLERAFCAVSTHAHECMQSYLTPLWSVFPQRSVFLQQKLYMCFRRAHFFLIFGIYVYFDSIEK